MGLILNDAYVQLAFISLIMLISFVLLRRGKQLNLKEPPLVPYKYPIIGHTIDYYKDNENFIKKCHAEYGEIFSLYLFAGREVFDKYYIKNFKTFELFRATIRLLHRELIKKKIIPVIEKRLREMKESGDNYVSPIDILQRFIELLHKNYKLVNNPQSHEEMLDEQEQLYKSNENPYYSIEQIARMEKLDSFIKETLRVNVDYASLLHKTLPPYFTFSNGYQVPKG
ncbi:cytochrome P450 [Rhizophagus diaphanus]|nr:cytochrome P450 [Rhizophagus diaphanus] [Rhizophagus sp. MUCL 43196]